MALFTLKEIREAVRFRGDYKNVRAFPDADLNREIQQSFGKFYQLVAEVEEGWWDTDTTITTMNGVPHVALPADVWRVQGVDLLDGGDFRTLRRVGRSDRNRFANTPAEPEAYRLSARGVELMPTPNAEYTLRVLYIPIAPALEEDVAREWYNGWDEFVIAETLRKLDEREGRPLGDRLTVLAEIEKTVRAGANRRDVQEPEYLVLRESVGVDEYERW